MKKKFLTFFSSAILSAHLFAGDDATIAKWNANTIIIDGDNSEYPKPFNLFDSKSGLMFVIHNDAQKLYLCFTNNDEAKIHKILRAGWKIEFTSKEKNNKFNASITFPELKRNEEKQDGENNKFKYKEPGERKKPDINQLVGNYKLLYAGATAEGFKTKNGLIPLTDTSKIAIAIGSNNEQELVYEIAIPLNELFSSIINLNELLNMKVTVNALEMPNFGGNSGEGGNGMHSGGKGGGHGGGGMGSGGSGGRYGGGGMGGGGQGMKSGGFSSDAFDKVTFKQNIRLTNQ